MHIAIDARIINSSTGRYVERLVTYLQDIDRENDYSILVRKKDLDFWVPKQPNFAVIEADFDDYSFAEQFGLKELLDRLKPDLVHFCMPQQPILYRGKSVTTVHDMTLLNTYNSDKNWLVFHAKQMVGRFVFKRIAKTNAHIIVPSDNTKREYQAFSGIADDKITRLYEAADVSPARQTAYKHPFKQFILYVGQQSDYKNIVRLAEAHQELLKTQPELGLILVGRKNASALKNEDIFTKRGYKNIVFTDFIEDEQRDWLFAHCAAYVFPSLMEGFGLPGLEAMGYGAPVVSSNASCLPEIYGEAAHYFDPKQVDDIARAIGEVLSDEALQRDLIEKGHLQRKKYSWKRMATGTQTIYEQVLGGTTNSSEQ